MKYNSKVYNLIKSKIANKEPQTAVLIDPDKVNYDNLLKLVSTINSSNIDYIFIGGSLIYSDIDACIKVIKSNTSKPLVIFPGNHSHISDSADAILLLSLISGRNPQYLIDNHVIAAPKLKQTDIEVISTSYLLIDGGVKTSVEYISNTKPIPRDKIDIAVATAIAGEMTGSSMIYLEAGSGAKHPVSSEMISEIKNNTQIPIIVGGGIRKVETVKEKHKAGADIVVIGSAIEENPDFIKLL